MKLADGPTRSVLPARSAASGSASLRALRHDLPIHAVALLSCLAMLPFADLGLDQGLRGFGAYLVYFLVAWLFSALLFRVGRYVLWTRPDRPARQLWTEGMRALRSGVLESWLPLVAVTALFGLLLGRFKSRIPDLAGGFTWDRTFMELDRSLHLGWQPYEWLQPLLGDPISIFLLTINYNLWFFVMWGAFFAFAIRPAGTAGRTRYLTAFFLTWAIAGGLLAWLFSSAGPCFYALVVPGEDPYAALMSHLRTVNESVPVLALRKQDLLWTQYAAGRSEFGISAMPSLHNALALLVVLGARDLAPRLRPWLIGHAILVFLGSILLGWHYAVDAYLSFLVVALVWWAVTPFSRWWDDLLSAEPGVAAQGPSCLGLPAAA